MSNTSTPGPAKPDLTNFAAVVEEQRRFARRDCKLRAWLQVLQTWDANFGSVREFEVMIRNISRTGACFLYIKQLYPDDRITLNFGDMVRHYRVARCRRISLNVYEIGVAVCAAPTER
jgi:hypothetical protein